MTVKTDRYIARDAAGLAGFKTVAMIDYLERQGIFLPDLPRAKRRGKRRTYSFRDVFVLKTIGTLLEHGASALVIKKALNDFQRQAKIDRATMASIGGNPLRYAIVSGGSLFCIGALGELEELGKRGQLAFSFMIELEPIHKHLRESTLVMAKLPY